MSSPKRAKMSHTAEMTSNDASSTSASQLPQSNDTTSKPDRETLLYDDKMLCEFLYDPQESRAANPRIRRSLIEVLNPPVGTLVNLPNESCAFEHIASQVMFVNSVRHCHFDWRGMHAIAQKGLKVTHIPYEDCDGFVQFQRKYSDTVVDSRYQVYELNRIARYTPVVIQIEYLFQIQPDKSTTLSFADYFAKPYFLRHCVTNTTRHCFRVLDRFGVPHKWKSGDKTISYREVKLQFYTKAANEDLQKWVKMHQNQCLAVEGKKKALYPAKIRSLECLDKMLLQHATHCENLHTREVLGSSDMRGEILSFLECKGGVGGQVCFENCESFIKTRSGGQLQMHLTRNGMMCMRNVRRYTNGIRHVEYDPTPVWRRFLKYFVAPSGNGRFLFVSDKQPVVPDKNGAQRSDLLLKPKYEHEESELDKAVAVAVAGNWKQMDSIVPLKFGETMIDKMVDDCKAFAMVTRPIAMMKVGNKQELLVRFSGMEHNTMPDPLKLAVMPPLDLSPI